MLVKVMARAGLAKEFPAGDYVVRCEEFRLLVPQPVVTSSGDRVFHGRAGLGMALGMEGITPNDLLVSMVH